MSNIARVITQKTALAYLADKPGYVLRFLQLPFMVSDSEGQLIAEKKVDQPFTVRYQPGSGLFMIYTKEDMGDKIMFATIEQIVEYIARKWW